MSSSIGKSRKMLGFVSSTKRRAILSFPLVRLVAYNDVGQVWDVHNFDAIVGPGLASPALIHK